MEDLEWVVLVQIPSKRQLAADVFFIKALAHDDAHWTMLLQLLGCWTAQGAPASAEVMMVLRISAIGYAWPRIPRGRALLT